MKWIWRTILAILIAGLLGLFCIYSINRQINLTAAEKIETSITEIPVEQQPRVAIVLGAKVWSNGELSHALYDRVITAVELHRAGRVKNILMSGDNPTKNYDEPTAMKQTAIQLGVPEEDIILDFAGRRTYDSCYRAKEIFGVEKAIIVTQEFHQSRSIYLCENAGIDSIGITADRRKYNDIESWKFREFFAVASAWFETNFIPFEPIKGEKEPIRQ